MFLRKLNIICIYLRSSYCEDTDIPADEYEFEKEEL